MEKWGPGHRLLFMILHTMQKTFWIVRQIF